MDAADISSNSHDAADHSVERNSMISIDQKSRISRLKFGFASSLVTQILTFSQAIIFVPFFIRVWGTEQYGEWLTLTAFLVYLTQLNLGGQNYVQNLLTDAYVKGNEKDFIDYLSQGLSLFAAICFAAFLGVMLLLILPNFSIPGLGEQFKLEYRLVALFIGISYLISVIGGIYATAYYAVGLYAFGTMIGNLLRVSELIVLSLVLYLGATPLIYSLTTLALAIIRLMIHIIIMRKKIVITKQVRISLRRAFEGRRFLKGSILFWFIGIAAAINYQGLVSVIALKISSTAVTIYVIHRTLTAFLRYPYNLIMGPIWPELSMLASQQKFDEASQLTIHFIKYVMLVTGLLGFFVWIWAPFVFPWWTQNEIAHNTGLMSILLIQTFVFSGWMAAGQPLLSANQHHFVALADMLNAIATITFVFILADNLIEVALITLICDLIFGMAMYPIITARFLDIPRFRFLGVLLQVIVLFVPIALLTYLIYMTHQNEIIYALFNTIILLIFFIPITYLLIGKTQYQRLQRTLLATSNSIFRKLPI
jgi:O-antigen/teichoic acid export membrane protein